MLLILEQFYVDGDYFLGWWCYVKFSVALLRLVCRIGYSDSMEKCFFGITW